MRAVANAAVLIAAGCVLGGCATQHYRAAPIMPSATAGQFESRSLADAGFRSFEERSLGHAGAPRPPDRWTLQTLSLAALYFNPALDLARARVAIAKGAVVTAGARPNPVLDLTPGLPAPYLLTQDLLFLVETAGKRGLRIQAARSLDQAARFDLANSAWTVVMGVRTALLNYLVASRRVGLLETQEKARADQVAILEQILSAGESTRFDVNVARIGQFRAGVAVLAAEEQLVDARSVLATAIGVPATALAGARFSWPDMDSPPSADSLSIDRVRRDAVLNRLDIRRALAQYAAAEADLHAEIARQDPNVHLGPGYTYEEGHSYFTLGFSIPLPVFNRNRGPIAEAEGRRQQAAAAFLQTQAQVIERSEQAYAAYAAALRTLAGTESSYRLQRAQLQVVRHDIAAGTDDRLSLDSAEIQASVLALTRLDAVAGAEQALGNLEDAVQQPLAPGEAWLGRLPSPSDAGR
ncbi:MAG: TolC family protein [Acidobacteriota bacterium]|nr:TolC family protein [Acidobacteriota bacterium]